MAHPEQFIKQAADLASAGLSDYSIAGRTGIARSTVQRWRQRGWATGGRNIPSWQVPDPDRCCYLLGCYLGDGHVLHHPPNGWTLRLACGRAYPEIIGEALVARAATFRPRQPTRRALPSAASDVLSISHPGVGSAFPQHGPGLKHDRTIELVGWQERLTTANPQALIRGLIHSDGCRVINRFRTRLPSGNVREYAYPRYFFTNLFADIRAIFHRHCAILGIRVTQSNHRNLTVSHRDSVAILDAFVGPKA
jgi:hypothetical protein